MSTTGRRGHSRTRKKISSTNKSSRLAEFGWISKATHSASAAAQEKKDRSKKKNSQTEVQQRQDVRWEACREEDHAEQDSHEKIVQAVNAERGSHEKAWARTELTRLSWKELAWAWTTLSWKGLAWQEYVVSVSRTELLA